MFTTEELTRYSRHIILPEIGRSGQNKIKKSHVFIVGAGGLGNPILLYLAAAGVGRISVIDNDKLELTNLTRQILYRTSDIKKAKVFSAAAYLRQLNPEIEIVPIYDTLCAGNILDYFSSADLIMETSDRFATKFLVNDASYFTRKKLIIGGILQFEGQVLAIDPGKSACYRCIFFEPPPSELMLSCSDNGVLGATAGIIGSIQAAQALKILAEIGDVQYGNLVTIDILRTEFRTIPIKKNSSCPLCGVNPVINSIKEEEYQCAEKKSAAI